MTKKFIQTKSELFSIRILKMQKYLRSKYGFLESVSQVSRSGTSIGANIAEAFSAQSDADFMAKIYISLKEANETSHWLNVLYGSQYLSVKEYESINADCQELIRLLIHTIKKKKSAMSNK